MATVRDDPIRERCDLTRSRIEVADSLADAGGHLHFGPTKNHRSRIVAIPRFVNDLQADHLARRVPDDPRSPRIHRTRRHAAA